MTEWNDDYLQEPMMGRRLRDPVRAGQPVKLPSDCLDPATLERRNGPCRTYRLGRPMRIVEFSEMPADLQRSYLRRLRLRGGSESDVERMLGVAPGRLRRYRVAFDRPDPEAWALFLASCGKEE